MGAEIWIQALANNNDPSGNPPVVSEVTDPDSGMVEIVSPNLQLVTYTPNPLFSGVDTFEYTTCDPGQLSVTALVTMIVNLIAVQDIENTRRRGCD